MKYLLYRSLGSIEKNVRKHELVGVEFGDSIDDVADALIRDVREDLAGLPEYENCETAARAPAQVAGSKYQYQMLGIVYPPYTDKNILIEFGVVETDE